ncbi:MAG: alpha/beta hydrolase [Solirubrobacteraceae bacterium]
MSGGANPHLAIAPVLAGATPGDATLVGVLVHGRDQDQQVMLDVAARLQLPGVGYVLPVAARRSWYPGRYYDPVAGNEPDVVWALESLDAAIAVAHDAGVPDRRIVLAGFSQGACIVAELVARRPRALAGVAVLTGSLLGPANGRRAPAYVAGLPMLFASSRHDEWIALDDAHATARAFARAGAIVTVETYEDRVHHVSDAAVSALRRLFTDRPTCP